MTDNTVQTSLIDVPVGSLVRISKMLAGQKMVRRMLGLGLRVGSHVTILHHRGNSVVVESGGTRIALGRGVVEKILAQPLAEDSE